MKISFGGTKLFLKCFNNVEKRYMRFSSYVSVSLQLIYVCTGCGREFFRN